MASMKLGSKVDVFQRQGQDWFCKTGLPSDIAVEVGEMSFHLHKFPLLSRSGVLARLIAEAQEDEESVIELPDIPGGANTFELVAKFCYNVKFELTASNVAYLRCAAEHLEMTEEYGEGNLLSQTETFLDEVVLKNWNDSLRALQSCDDILPYAEEIVTRCIKSLSEKASANPDLFGWPLMEHVGVMQNPGGSVLWNGISIGAKTKNSSSDLLREDVTTLSLPLYKRLIAVVESHGISQEIIAGSLATYAKKYLPGLNRRLVSGEGSTPLTPVSLRSPPSEEDQKILLEDIDQSLPFQKGLVSTKFLFGLLRTAILLQASPSCISNLEKRIGMQLDQAAVEDLLLPNYSYSVETLYNVDCVQRILEHFLAMDEDAGGASPDSVDDGHLLGSPSLTPVTMVAKLIDGYLVEVAPDFNLKLANFQALAESVPDYARPLDDGLYRAIDIYLKNHPWMAESEKEQLCRLMNSKKLSLEACTHAAQNERLPLRTIVQVIMFEQVQLRTSIAGCFLVSDNLDGSRQLKGDFPESNEGGGLTTAARKNQVLKVGMDNMRTRVSELEKECSNLRQEVEKLGNVKGSSTWGIVPKKLGFKIKSQLCNALKGSASNKKNGNSNKVETMKDGYEESKRNSSDSDKGSVSSIALS